MTSTLSLIIIQRMLAIIKGGHGQRQVNVHVLGFLYKDQLV